jgi:hypothetical protein
MVAFPGVADQVRADMHLHKHFRYFLREARVTAYAQVRSFPRGRRPYSAATAAAARGRDAALTCRAGRRRARARSSWSRTRA